MLGMLLRHVPWLVGHAGIELADMSSNTFVVKIDFNQLVAGMQLHLFAHAVMWNRVKVLVVDQVIIDIDSRVTLETGQDN